MDVHRFDSAGVAVVEIRGTDVGLPVWEIGESVIRVEPTGEGPAPLLEVVSEALWLRDGSIVVADIRAHTVHLFDESGTYQQSFGRQGDGPGEFRSINTVARGTGDRVLVYDRSSARVTWLDGTRGFVGSQPLPTLDRVNTWVEGVWPWREGGYVWQLRVEQPAVSAVIDAPEVERRPSIAIVDEVIGGHPEGGGGVRLKGPFSAATSAGDLRAPFTHAPFVAVSETTVIAGSGEEFELVVHDAGLRPSRIVRWSGIESVVTGGEVTDVRMELLGERPSTRKRELVSLMLSDEVIPAARPALGRVLIGPRGEIWASRFEPLRRFEKCWYVLRGDGTPMAAVPLPATWRARLADVREDRVLLIAHDAVNVPRVEVRELLRHREAGGGGCSVAGG